MGGIVTGTALMTSWQKTLRFDPIKPLLSSNNEILEYFVRRDLLDETVEPITSIWDNSEPQKILRKQQDDGSWPYPGKHKETYKDVNYSLIETWKIFRYLIEKYEFNKKNDATRKSAEYLFSCQTEEGDIRGILANQYSNYYTGAIMALLIKAGYGDDARIERGFQWLLKTRQIDSGWAVPILTTGLSWQEISWLTGNFAQPVAPDLSKPFSHHTTGMILRAFAAHKTYRKSEAARKAADLVKSRFFMKDVYSSFKDADYWLRFQFPFWWNNLVTALDSMRFVGLTSEDQAIRNALHWLVNSQEKNGLWKVSYSKKHKITKSKRTEELQLWVTLSICRVIKSYHEHP
jgi:squalene cyclase